MLDDILTRLESAVVAAAPYVDPVRHANWLKWAEEAATTGIWSAMAASHTHAWITIVATERGGMTTIIEDVLRHIAIAAECYATAVEWSQCETAKAREFATREWSSLATVNLNRAFELLGVS